MKAGDRVAQPVARGERKLDALVRRGHASDAAATFVQEAPANLAGKAARVGLLRAFHGAGGADAGVLRVRGAGRGIGLHLSDHAGIGGCRRRQYFRGKNGQ